MGMEVLLETISEFRGKSYPDIPLPFDRSELPEDAFFVTLPIGEVDAKSSNGRTYLRPAIESIVKCINTSHPMGWWGHPELKDRTETPPAINWLGAVIDDAGTAWGKCYAISEDAKNLLRSAKLLNRKIGTSIYGNALINPDNMTVHQVELAYIDLLAEGGWGGVPQTASVPVLTSESALDGTEPSAEQQAQREDRLGADQRSADPSPADNQTPAAAVSEQQLSASTSPSQSTDTNNIQETEDMSEERLRELEAQVKETALARDTASAEVATLKATQQTQVQELEQLRPQAQMLQGIRQLIKEGSELWTRLEINLSGYGDDLQQVIKDVIAKLQALAADKLMAQMETVVAESVKVADLRPMVMEMLKSKGIPSGSIAQTEAAIKQNVEEILAAPHMVRIAESLVSAAAGPNATTAAQTSSTARDQMVNAAVDQAQSAAQRMGGYRGGAAANKN